MDDRRARIVNQPHGTVLVVDDVADARELVSTILTLGGYTVVEAATGNEALQRVEEAPDLVVLDVHLPDIDGFEVCRRIKSDPRSATTPVVFDIGLQSVEKVSGQKPCFVAFSTVAQSK